MPVEETIAKELFRNAITMNEVLSDKYNQMRFCPFRHKNSEAKQYKCLINDTCILIVIMFLHFPT